MAEASTSATSQAGGDTVEVPAADTTAAQPLEIIDLDGPDFLGEDMAIFEAVLERLLSDPEKSRVGASESAAPEAATRTRAAEPVGKEPVLDAAATEQPGLSLVGRARAPETPVTLEAIEEVLKEPAVDAELTPIMFSSPAAVVGATVVSASESSSPRPTSPVIEAVPIANPTCLAPQEHGVPGSMWESPPRRSKRSGRV